MTHWSPYLYYSHIHIVPYTCHLFCCLLFPSPFLDRGSADVMARPSVSMRLCDWALGFYLAGSYFCAAWPGRACLGPPPSLGFLVAGLHWGSPLSGFHTRWGLAQAIVIGEET